jgi:hypothetical protein
VRLALALLLLAASCSDSGRNSEGSNAPGATKPAPLPKGATSMPGGYLTILEAPLPAPFAALDGGQPPASQPSGPPDLVHPPVPPSLRRFIRAFPQSEKPNGDVLDLGSEHAIVLRNGCFFLDREGDEDPLVRFPLHVGLTLDEEGYLAIRSRFEGQRDYVRVGLSAQTGWFAEPYSAPPDVAGPCAARTMVGVTTVSNPYAAPERFLPVLRRFRDEEGLTEAEAVARANACVQRRAAKDADRRLRGSKQNVPECRMLWGY